MLSPLNRKQRTALSASNFSNQDRSDLDTDFTAEPNLNITDFTKYVSELPQSACSNNSNRGNNIKCQFELVDIESPKRKVYETMSANSSVQRRPTTAEKMNKTKSPPKWVVNLRKRELSTMGSSQNSSSIQTKDPIEEKLDE